MQGRGEGMIKLLIVDDEMQARTGLRDMVPWESLGVTLCGEAEDAEAALPLIDEYQPDILLTDVRMHAMDGISLAWEAQQRLPDISIVFISAYMDTNYLREALHLNAADYISKPIRIQDVKKTIGKVVEDIQSRRASQEQRRRLEKLVEQSRPLLIERFLHSWLEGLFSTREELLRQAAELNLSLEQPLVPAVFQYDARSPLEPRAYNAYCLWLSGELPRYFPGALFCAHYNEGIAFLPETIWQEEERFSAVLNELRREAKASYGVELLIGLGTPRTNLLEIPQAVREARFALESSDFQHRAQPETSARRSPFMSAWKKKRSALKVRLPSRRTNWKSCFCRGTGARWRSGFAGICPRPRKPTGASKSCSSLSASILRRASMGFPELMRRACAGAPCCILRCIRWSGN